MKYAVIDIGSNTVRLCVYQVEGTKLSLLLNQSVMARLGSKTQNGAMTQEGIQAACDALEQLREPIKRQGVEKTLVFATAALRNITNSKEAVELISQRSGFSIDLLSGEKEALFTFMGAGSNRALRNGVLADIGGGSSELILIRDGLPVKTASLPIGSLTAFVRFVGRRPAKPEQIATLRQHVLTMIAEHFSPEDHGEVLYGIGGAARSAYELERLLDPAAGGAIRALETLLKRLLADEVLAEKSILQASPERLDSALPGIAILCAAAQFFGCKTLEICNGGVREGYLLEQLAKKEGA
ncbi:MAG: hypothetical protein E7414_03600 [Ruminococcaceae bacterium]|nr:hypothetical protein [Oscillospiraceae bacterium]